MYKNYVYFILSQNRLIIVQTEIKDEDYHLLLNNDGYNQAVLLTSCKMFCIGYIMGNTSRNAVNSLEEFQ